jgi:hypothetical protein
LELAELAQLMDKMSEPLVLIRYFLQLHQQAAVLVVWVKTALTLLLATVVQAVELDRVTQLMPLLELEPLEKVMTVVLHIDQILSQAQVAAVVALEQLEQLAKLHQVTAAQVLHPHILVHLSPMLVAVVAEHFLV